MALVEVSDFVGKLKIPSDTLSTLMTQSYIDRYLTEYGCKIYGAQMWTEIVAYLDAGILDDPDLNAVLNAFQIDMPSCSCIGDSVLISRGIKDALCGLIYWHNRTDAIQKPSQVNATELPISETSETSSRPSVQLYNRYNESVTTIKAIQQRIINDRSKYPSFNGQKFLYNYLM